MRERTEAALVEHATGASDERLIALRQRYRDERLCGRRARRDRLHLRGAHAHRLFHHEGIAVVEQVLRRLRHARVRAERDHEIRSRLLEHRAVIGEHRGGADRRRALGDDHGVGIVQSDELDVVHARQQTQVGGVVERVPVADLDGGDADLRRHYAPVSRIRAA